MQSEENPTRSLHIIVPTKTMVKKDKMKHGKYTNIRHEHGENDELD